MTRKKYFRWLNKKVLHFLYLFFFSSYLQAAAHFTLKGTVSDNNLILRTQASQAASVSVSVDLSTYFQIGITHRQATNTLEGFYLNEDGETYDYSKEKTISVANSLDFTIILYYGQLFTPYIQIGVVKKNYLLSKSVNYGPTEKESYSFPVAPNGGIGLSIRLNQNFSLNLSYTVSPAVKQTNPALEAETALDSYSSIGITYNT